MGMARKGSDHVFDEVVHPAVRAHLNLRVTGDLQNRQEEGEVFQQALLHRRSCQR